MYADASVNRKLARFGVLGSDGLRFRPDGHPEVENPNPFCCWVSDSRRLVCGVGGVEVERETGLKTSGCRYARNRSPTGTIVFLRLCNAETRPAWGVLDKVWGFPYSLYILYLHFSS